MLAARKQIGLTPGVLSTRRLFVDTPKLQAYKTDKAVPRQAAKALASQQDIDNFNRLRLAAASSTDLTNQILPKLPEFPDDVLKRFPSLREHQNKLEAWRVKANIAIRGGTS